MVSPRLQKLSMLGLGGSVGTRPENITADIVVVLNFDELTALGEENVSSYITMN